MRARDAFVAAAAVAALLLLAPLAIQQLRVSQRRQICQARQLRIGQAMLRYEQARQALPGYRNVLAPDRAGRRRPTGWVFPLLPYIGYQDETNQPGPWAPIHDKFAMDADPATRGWQPAAVIPDLVCPSNRPAESATATSRLAWVVNAGMPDAAPGGPWPPDWPANGVFHDRFTNHPKLHPVSLDYIERRDGVSFTLMLSENVDAGRWTDDSEALVGFVWVAGVEKGEADPGRKLMRINQATGQGDGSIRFARPSSYHVGGVNALFADGVTQFLNEQIDYLLFTYQMTPAGAEIRYPGAETPVTPPYGIVNSP